MTASARRTWLLALVAFLAAVAGVFVGRALSEVPKGKSANALHEVLHERLNLSTEQEARISKLEADFAVRRKALEAELKADNARLAAAIQTEHGYGPQVTAEVDRSHQAMGQLQKETLAHIFAMRAALTPDQARVFDKAVTDALTAEAR